MAVLVSLGSQLFAGTAAVWHAAEARHAAESLGLTPRALAALSWRIVDDE